MLTVTKDQKPGVVHLSGTIDESDDLKKLIGQPTGALTVICSKVTRINSVGIKSWMKYFGEVSKQGVALKFEEVSYALVEQMNFVKNFNCEGTVSSLVLPYQCGKCETALAVTMTVENLKKINFTPPQAKCPKCGSGADFDEIPEEYFSFLKE